MVTLVEQKEHEEWHVKDEFDPEFDGRAAIHEYDSLNLEETGRGIPSPKARNWDVGWKPGAQAEVWFEALEKYYHSTEKRWIKTEKWFFE